MKKINLLFVIIIIVLIALLVFVWLENNSNKNKIDDLEQKFQKFESKKQTTEPLVKLISPNGGEEFVAGKEYYIKWYSQNLDDYKISLHLKEANPTDEAGQKFDPILMFDLVNDGYESWQVPEDLPVGLYVIEVVAYEKIPITNSYSDISDAHFKVIR